MAEQISAFLGNMFELLTGGDRAAPPRQRALGAATYLAPAAA